MTDNDGASIFGRIDQIVEKSMSKAFASQGDLSEKTISFTEIADLWAFTAEGDPNTGVIIGDDSVMVIDAQPHRALPIWWSKDPHCDGQADQACGAVALSCGARPW